MPKKRAVNLKQFQGSSSSSSHAPGQDGGDSLTATVNERLEELRKDESFDAAQKKRELAELVSQRSVPPELRAILGVPEVAPPRPKTISFRDRMRTPGPATPQSWLDYPEGRPSLSIRGGRRTAKKAMPHDRYRNRPKQPLRFAGLTAEKAGGSTAPLHGLLHAALRRMAEHWDSLDEDYASLQDMPLRLRLRLLSYIGAYGPAIDVTFLRAITQDKDAIRRLDLAGLVGHGQLTMKTLTRMFAMASMPRAQLNSDLPDDWEAESSGLPTHKLDLANFGMLTHLSLSHPPADVAWRDLLALTRHTSQVTHLSLAYWPKPSLTPNLATTTIAHRHGPDVHAGGTHYYSMIDQDYAECASVLRQLSSRLLCLQWLDLEGCAEWMPALTFLAIDTASAFPTETDLQPAGHPTTSGVADVSGWDSETRKVSVFAAAWRDLASIRCAQPLLPDIASFEVPEFVHRRQYEKEVQAYITACATTGVSLTSHNLLGDTRRAEMWARAEQSVITTAHRVNAIRRARSSKPILFDFGWMKKAV